MKRRKRRSPRRKSSGEKSGNQKPKLTRWEQAANLEEKALREDKHWTMTEAAGHCHLTRPAISQHEHQWRGMTLDTMVKIARGYGLKGPDFFLNSARRWLKKATLWLMLSPEWDGVMTSA